jgi:hypothetical protein
MTNPSNMYAEKIYSEHPIALWALDDVSDFVSLLTPSNQGMVGWTVNDGAVSISPPSGFELQIQNSPSIKVNATATDRVLITSPEILNFRDLDPEKDSFNFGFFFNPRTDKVTSVRIGYKYGSTATKWETFTSFVENSWVFLNKTFYVPIFQNQFVDEEFSLVVEINTANNSGNYEYFINGLSLGQWSEPFNTQSSGVFPKDIPSTIALSGGKAIEASAYGTLSNKAYYLASDKKLFATNEGFPLVYGAQSLTKIFPNTNLPSMILPGFGFLNDSGQYKDYTFETWLRVSPKSYVPRRIFGPISSTDGLYVDGEFLTLKINDVFGSHFVGEWGRPMLLQIKLGTNTASLVLNGEQVVSIDIDTNSLNLPARLSSSNKNQDWLGFYAYPDVPSLEIDCPAIYSYQVPEVVAKRRFVYGQGVDFPESSNSSFGGSSAVIDFKVAGYANNYLYPDMGRWNQGSLENLTTDSNFLSPPKYALPEIKFNNSQITNRQWLNLCKTANLNQPNSFVDLSLADIAGSVGGYMFIPKLNFLQQEVKAFYGVFQTDSPANQVLFKLENTVEKVSLTISLESGKVKYLFTNGAEAPTVLLSTDTISDNAPFVAGLDMLKFSRFFGGSIAKFLGSPSKLSLYIGGSGTYENTFSGRIYRFGVASARSLLGFQSLSDADGKIVVNENENITVGGASQNSVAFMINYISSYTLKPRLYLESFDLDISTNSYWQDYLPLTYFAKAVLDTRGDLEQDLDYLQFNVDVPVLPIFSGTDYDTSGAEVKTYIAFQTIASGANKTNRNFSNTKKIGQSGVIDPIETEWVNTRYEVVNDSIIYLPKNVDFKTLAIVTQIEIVSNAILTATPKVKRLQYSSQAVDATRPTKINTRFGVPMFPYTKSGIYEDYKAKNPLTIYKNSSPYLYLTENSGVRLRGVFSSGPTNRGIRVVINQQKSLSYQVGAIQIVGKFDNALFPINPVEVYQINSSNRSIAVYIVADNSSRTRGRMYAVNSSTLLPEQGVTFYLNGKATQTLYLKSGDWNMIGMQFTNSLNFDGFSGSVVITGPMLFNNIANYTIPGNQLAQTFIFRTWNQARSKTGLVANANTRNDDSNTPAINEGDNVWNDFILSNPVISWENVLFIPTTRRFLLDPAKIYKEYTGTNKIIVGDNQTLRFKDYSYTIYKGLEWESRMISAV